MNFKQGKNGNMVAINHTHSLLNTILDYKEIIIFLGEGASMEGTQEGKKFPGFDELIDKILKTFDFDTQNNKNRIDNFLTVIKKWEKERKVAARLREFLDGEPGPAHYYLAALSIALFGESNALLYLTTNFDDLMKKAFTVLERNPVRKFRSVVIPLHPHITGPEFQEIIINIESSIGKGRPVILKLFGDLNSQSPIPGQDNLTFQPEVEQKIIEWMQKPMIVIGYSFPDRIIEKLLIASRGIFPVFLVNPSNKVPPPIKYLERIYHIKINFSDFVSHLVKIIEKKKPAIGKKVDKILEFLGLQPEQEVMNYGLEGQLLALDGFSDSPQNMRILIKGLFSEDIKLARYSVQILNQWCRDDQSRLKIEKEIKNRISLSKDFTKEMATALICYSSVIFYIEDAKDKDPLRAIGEFIIELFSNKKNQLSVLSTIAKALTQMVRAEGPFLFGNKYTESGIEYLWTQMPVQIKEYAKKIVPLLINPFEKIKKSDLCIIYFFASMIRTWDDLRNEKRFIYQIEYRIVQWILILRGQRNFSEVEDILNNFVETNSGTIDFSLEAMLFMLTVIYPGNPTIVKKGISSMKQWFEKLEKAPGDDRDTKIQDWLKRIIKDFYLLYPHWVNELAHKHNLSPESVEYIRSQGADPNPSGVMYNGLPIYKSFFLISEERRRLFCKWYLKIFKTKGLDEFCEKLIQETFLSLNTINQTRVWLPEAKLSGT
jgi:hypothetical protein